MKRNTRLLLVIIFFLPLAADAAPPQRIISLGPAITEELYLLGVADKLVGCTVYCQVPAEAKSKEKVGRVVDVDVEKIALLRPEIVLATPLLDSEAVKNLERLGIKVVTFPTAKSFSQVCRQFLVLGELVGEEKQARAIVARARSEVESINSKVSALPEPKVFTQTGARPLYTANKDSYLNDYIVRAGGINIAAGSAGGSDYSIYSREEVVKENPDVIFIVTMGIAGEQEKRAWERFTVLNAVRNKRIYIIDSHRACSPTPVSFAQMLAEIAVLLHPGLWVMSKVL